MFNMLLFYRYQHAAFTILRMLFNPVYEMTLWRPILIYPICFISRFKNDHNSLRLKLGVLLCSFEHLDKHFEHMV